MNDKKKDGVNFTEQRSNCYEDTSPRASPRFSWIEAVYDSSGDYYLQSEPEDSQLRLNRVNKKWDKYGREIGRWQLPENLKKASLPRIMIDDWFDETGREKVESAVKKDRTRQQNSRRTRLW